MAIATALVLAGCSTGGATDSPDPEESVGSDGVLTEMTTVSVGISSAALWSLPVLMSEKWDSFTERNITLDVQTLPSSESFMLASTGKLDAVFSGPAVGLYNAIYAGTDLKIAAPGYVQSPETNSGLWVSTAALGGKKFKPEMLKGKKIASSQGNTGSSIARVTDLLEEGGLTVDDVEIVTMPSADQVIALENGSIFAGIILEPLHLPLVESGSAIKVHPQIPDGFPGVAFLFGPTLLEERPEVGKAFVAALRDMYRDHLQGDYLGDERAEDIAAALGQEVKSLQRSTADPYMTELSFPDDYIKTYDTAWRKWDGLLENPKPFTNKDVIDTRFMDWANAN